MDVTIQPWTTGAVSTASVSSTASTVLAASTTNTRSFARVTNDGASNVYIALGATAVAGKGILLVASGGFFEINRTNLFRGDISAITASGTSTLSIQEGY